MADISSVWAPWSGDGQGQAMQGSFPVPAAMPQGGAPGLPVHPQQVAAYGQMNSPVLGHGRGGRMGMNGGVYGKQQQHHHHFKPNGRMYHGAGGMNAGHHHQHHGNKRDTRKRHARNGGQNHHHAQQHYHHGHPAHMQQQQQQQQQFLQQHQQQLFGDRPTKAQLRIMNSSLRPDAKPFVPATLFLPDLQESLSASSSISDISTEYADSPRSSKVASPQPHIHHGHNAASVPTSGQTSPTSSTAVTASEAVSRSARASASGSPVPHGLPVPRAGSHPHQRQQAHFSAAGQAHMQHQHQTMVGQHPMHHHQQVSAHVPSPLMDQTSASTVNNVDDADEVVDGHELLRNYLYHKYVRFLDRAMEERRRNGPGRSPLFESLYTFWVERLQHKFNRNMYDTFKACAIQDLQNRSRVGMEALYKFLRLSLLKLYRDKLFRDFIALVANDISDESNGVEMLWLFLRERNDDIRRKSMVTEQRQLASRPQLAAALRDLDLFDSLSLE